MDIHTNIPLKNYTTMKIGGNARFLADAHSKDEVAELCRNAKSRNIPIFIIGGGSNVIAKDEGFNGLVIRIKIPGFEVIADEMNYTEIKVGAGETWDSVVEKTVNMGLSGIEAMSGIPGTAGACPVQNVGAYGQEIADTLVSVEAYDIMTDNFINIENKDCLFAYRDSIFKNAEKGRFVILSTTLKLLKNLPKPPFYEALQKYFDENQISIYSQRTVRDAVLKLRTDKLPDPSKYANSGSFFKNAIIEDWQVNDVKKIDPNIPMYDMGDGLYKVPTGWLIEHAGLKGQLFHGMRIYEKNALILVNESAENYHNLADARNEIEIIIREKYGIQIEQEPIEI